MDKGGRKKGGGGDTLDSSVRAPDLDIVLRFSETQVAEPLLPPP